MKKRLLYLIPVIAIFALLAAACGSYPKDAGSCRVYLAGDQYRVRITLFGSGSSNSVRGHELLEKACEAVRGVR